MVTMNPGWGDMSRADQVQDGLESRSASVLYEWIDPPQTEAEADALVLSLAASGSYMLIIAVGEELADSVDAAAVAHPNQKFAMIGAEISDRPNVASATFAMEEGAFLAGVTAAFVATNDPGRLIGILGTVQTDAAVNRLIAGFTQGVEEANETYNLRVHLHETRWVGSYNDSDAAYNEAMTFFTQINTSIIFAPVRASYPGVRQAMIEANVTLIEGYTFRDPYVIAAENHLDRYGLPNLDINSGRTWITTSVTATYDLAAFNIINQTLWNEFTPGNVHFNLENGGVNITEFRWSEIYVTTERLDDIFAYQESIFNGTIVITVP
jgi:basic membrane protein A